MKIKFFSPTTMPFFHWKFINTNPANSYRSGYEDWMRMIPVIDGTESMSMLKVKLQMQEIVIKFLAHAIKDEPWIWENWPKEGAMLTRTVLAIEQPYINDSDEYTYGAEIVLVRWNQSETPIHGHHHGQMIDFLIEGSAVEKDYKLLDATNRIVKTSADFSHAVGPMETISNGYYAKSNLNLSSLVHKFSANEKTITLHFIPAHPVDGNGNLFTEVK